MYLIIKRSADVIVATLALFIIFPFLLIILLVCYFDLGYPILFSQRRIGKNNKLFMLYKFRTMNLKKDLHGNLLPDIQRTTKIGAFLRKTSLDELPELLNIILGQMSFVGPRPLLPDYLPLYTDRQIKRHDVLPGLTGLAQVNGRNSISWNRRFSLDVIYVNKISFYLDCAIIYKTLFIVLSKSGINSSSSETMPFFTGK